MGVRGLTTFIANNAEEYLKPYELHDTKLVIDGDNLCIHLFKRTHLTSAPLGGNYDLYYRVVLDFFKMLSMCNVEPYVLLDGGYEARKMKTVKERMVQNIRAIRRFNIASTANARPLLLREVFVDAARASGVSVMRCPFEADDEAAILARKLNCPVMSYDSDFYIHNVQYIPYVTVTHKVYRKVTDAAGDNFEIGIVEWSKTGAARKTQRVKFVAQYGDEQVLSGDTVDSYCYLDCSLYTLDNLIGPDARLQKDMVPLFSVLLGNDYIERKVLAPFYASIRGGVVQRRKTHKQQKRVKTIQQWLQTHTLESATRSIASHVGGGNKRHIYRQILTAIRGYNCEDCISYGYFGFGEGELEDEEIVKQIEDELGVEVGKDSDVSEDDSDGLDEEEEEEETESDNDASEEEDRSQGSVCADEAEKFAEQTGEQAGKQEEQSDTDSVTEDAQELEEDEEEDDEEDDEDNLDTLKPYLNTYNDHRWPAWFRDLYRSAQVPRFLADLLHSNICVNYPQVEDITKRDSNAVSYPILQMIFTILKLSSTQQDEELKYMSRRVKTVGVCYEWFPHRPLPAGVRFDPETGAGNLAVLEALFKECGVPNWQELYRAIRKLPANLQLYCLIIIYWAKSRPAVNEAHVHALFVCLLQLQIVDPSLKSKNRNVKLFHQQNGTYLEEQRVALKASPPAPLNGAGDDENELTRAFYNQLSRGTSRGQLMLVYARLIGHFAPNEKLNRKHTSVDRTLVHTIATLQSVCYNFYGLVPLLGYPFENVRMHTVLNSMFVYNVYETLKMRPSTTEYVCSVFFRQAPMLQSAFRRLARLMDQFVPELQSRKRPIKGQAKAEATAARRNDDAATVERKPPKTKKVATSGRKPAKSAARPIVQREATSESDDAEFVDVNNKFSQLLLAS